MDRGPVARGTAEVVYNISSLPDPVVSQHSRRFICSFLIGSVATLGCCIHHHHHRHHHHHHHRNTRVRHLLVIITHNAFIALGTTFGVLTP